MSYEAFHSSLPRSSRQLISAAIFWAAFAALAQAQVVVVPSTPQIP